MLKKKKLKKLELHQDTIRQLTSRELATAEGGNYPCTREPPCDCCCTDSKPSF